MKTTECFVLIIMAIVVIGLRTKAEDAEDPTARAEELYEDHDNDSIEPSEDEEDEEDDAAIEDAGFGFQVHQKFNPVEDGGGKASLLKSTAPL
eukprot:gene9737-10732_t